MGAAGELFQDPNVQRFAYISNMASEIIKLIEQRDLKMADPLRRDSKGDPVILREKMSTQEQQNLIDAINYRIAIIQAKALELTSLDLTSFNALGTIS